MSQQLDEVRSGSTEIAFKIGGLLQDGQPAQREMLYEEWDDRLPRSARTKVSIFTGELAPGAQTDWHLHRGPVYHIVLRGRLHIETDEGAREYGPGDAYTELVDRRHRATNPDPDESVLTMSFQLTPEGADVSTTADNQGPAGQGDPI